MGGGVNYSNLSAPTIDGAPTIVRLPKKVKPEDITIDDLRHLSTESFALWTQTSGVTVDGNTIDFNSHRYLLPIYLCNDTEMVWQKAAQMGATVFMLLKVIHWLHTHQGRKAGLYFPTKEGVENLSKDRLTPLLQSIPDLNSTIDLQDKLGLRKIGKSSFYLFHLGGVASKDSVPLDFVAFDEVRLCKPQDIDQAMERISHSPYKQKILMSTCHVGDTEVFVRNKTTGHVLTKNLRDLQSCFKEYEVLSYNRLGGYRPRWRDIIAVHNNGIKPVVDVVFEGGQRHTCTPDHRFAVNGQGLPLFGERCFLPISEIQTYPKASHTPGKQRVYALKHLPTLEGNSYDLQTNEFFGLYIAEGTYREGTVSIWQSNKTEKNKAVRDLSKSWAVDNGLQYSETEEAVHVSGLSSRPDLVEVLTSCGGHAAEKRIPESILCGNEVQLKHLLHGFVLGDGHIYDYQNLSSKTFDLYTCSRQLAKDLQLVCFKTGCPASLTIRDRINTPVIIDGKKTGHTRHAEHKLSLNPGGFRHSELLRGVGGLEVRSVKEAGEQEVFDLTVAEDSWYFLAGSGALAHNCGLPESDIAARFDLGTQHVWMAKCGCEDGCDLARTFPDCVVDDKKRGKLYLRCPKCRYVINDPQNGRYVSHNPGADYTSFHVSQLTSKYMPLKTLWDFYHRTTNKAEFYNAKLGLPYIDEENRGVTLGQLKSCIDPQLEWAAPGKVANTAMGVDVGGGYCYVVIADLHESRKRIRHVEIIETDNPHYMENGKRVSPFKRLRTLMKEYKVQLCVIDAMPNYDSVIEFAQEFPGKVFASFYSKEAKDVVSWSDKPKTKATIKKAGPLLKFKYYCVLSRYISLDVALGQWSGNDVVCPDPDRLVQMCLNERTKDLEPEAVMNRAFSMFMRLIKRFNITNDETGEGRHEWIYSGGDPHFAHAWNYCNVALERLRRNVVFTFG